MPVVNPHGGSIAVYFDPSGPVIGGIKDTVTVDLISLEGAGTDGTVALSSANTWFQVPDSGNVPTSDYLLIVTKENASGQLRFSFSNGGTPSTTNGNKFEGEHSIIELAASEVIYFGSDTAGDDVNWTAKII